MMTDSNVKTTFSVLSIPDHLKQIARWAPWRLVHNKKRSESQGRDVYDKVPHRADNPNFGISTGKPEQWFSFDAAVRAVERNPDKFDGVGFCITGQTDLVMVDLDNCVVNGVIAPWADEVVSTLDSYTEFSPSGLGLRIVVQGSVPFDWTNHDVGIEVYAGHQNRFLTITGDHLLGSPATVARPDPEVLADLASRYARERKTAEIIDLAMPDLLDELMLPDPAALPISDAARAFLEYGAAGDDRSGTLHATGVALYAAGLDDAVVFSLLVSNEHAMEVALDHRRQDSDRAMLYLWREHCVKARPKARALVASPDEFDVITAPKGEPKPLPMFSRDGKGQIEAKLSNLAAALSRPDICGMQVGLDVFRDELMFVPFEGSAWVPLKDADIVRFRQRLEQWGFKPVSGELARDAISLAADNNRFDPAVDWVSSLKWDGVKRIDRFYIDYLGVEDSDYAQAVGAYTWTALAGRALSPGIKADMVPILVGAQGLGKTASVAAMSPDPEFFAEVDLSARDDDLSRRMRGCLIAEIGELRGLHTRDLESIKSFITRTHEHWVPKFKEFATIFPRRLLFIGTTNQAQFLADPTGNRRWLPLNVTKADRAAIERDREQLWAEGAARFKDSGIAFRQAEVLAQEHHEQFEFRDSWEEVVKEWLVEPDPLTGVKPNERNFLRVGDVLTGALGFRAQNIARKEEMRMGAVFSALGFTRKRLRVEGKLVWVYVQDE